LVASRPQEDHGGASKSIISLAFVSEALAGRRHGQRAHFRVQIAGHVAPRRQESSGAHSSRQQVFCGWAGGTTTIGCGMLGMGENCATAGQAWPSARRSAKSLKFRRMAALRLLSSRTRRASKGVAEAGWLAQLYATSIGNDLCRALKSAW